MQRKNLLVLFGAFTVVFNVMSGAQKIVFDTDPAFFNDDGHAAVMMLRSPGQIQVLGMTVVAGNTWAADGAGYMQQVLDLLGRKDLPLLIGAQHPLVRNLGMVEREKKQWGPLQFVGGFAGPLPKPSTRLGGVEFLIDAIERNTGKITILAIGPMTNIAIALRLRPDLADKIAQIVWMGGNVSVPGNVSKAAEFNFWFDPEAAQVVLRSRIPKKIMFGLDICNRAKLTRKHFDQIVAAKTPITDLYREALGNGYPGFLKNPNVTSFVWDCLAANWLLDPAFVTKSETRYLDVDTQFGKTYGAVVPLDRALAADATPVQVMLDLDFARFFAGYKRLLTER
jgi:inosine-uridine nucleoside N-ribohydrolase